MSISAIIFDFGDTIAREETEEKDKNNVTLSADLFPGAKCALKELSNIYQLAILADSVPGTGSESYLNVLKIHGIADIFDPIVTSCEVGCNKPDPLMFKRVTEKLEIDPENLSSVLMVGNRLDRDIAGGNRFGLVTVWAKMSFKYRRTVIGLDENPHYSFENYADLVPLVEQINRDLKSGTRARNRL